MSAHSKLCFLGLMFVLSGCADGEVAGSGVDRPDGWDTAEGDMGAVSDLEELGEEDLPSWLEEDLGLSPEEPLDMDDDIALDMVDEPPVAPPEPDEPAPPEPVEEPDPQEPNTPTAKTIEFSTLHWNIAGGKENACRPDLIRRAVMRFVRESAKPIDFISLNEVCASQYDAIEEALRGYWKKGPNAKFSAFQPSNGSRVGNAFFSRVNVSDVTRLELGTDQYGKRFLLCGLQNNRRLRVCTTHLTPGDGQARVQLGRVLNKIEDWWMNRSDTVVIGGDFNLHPHDVSFNRMYAAGANTPNNPGNTGHYRELDDDDAQHCRGYGERTTPGTTGGPCREGGKIDFTFVRANRIVGGTYRADSLNVPTDCTGVCSDHRPLRGFVKLRYKID